MFGNKYKFFVVTKSGVPNTWLTVTENKTQALEYIDKYIQLQHAQHYKLWSEARNLDFKDDNVWTQYLLTCVPKEEVLDFQIGTLKYKKEHLISILRMFTHCVPIGCSYDQDPEYVYLLEYVKANVGKSPKLEELAALIDEKLNKGD